MPRPRFTIRGMMIAVVVAAVVLTALTHPTILWASATFTLAFGLLLFSIPGIVYRRGRKRAFWVGFAVFGWGDLLWSLTGSNFRRDGPHLITTVFAQLLTFVVGDINSPRTSSALMMILSTNARELEESFAVIVLSLLCLVIAYAGGVVVVRVFGDQDRDVTKDAAPSVSPP